MCSRQHLRGRLNTACAGKSVPLVCCPVRVRAVRASLAAARAAAGSVGASLLRSRLRARAEAPEKGKIEFFNSSL